VYQEIHGIIFEWDNELQ